MKYGEKSSPIGLVQNADDVHFQCGTCEFFKDGECLNLNPKLHHLKVHPEWCCNLYRHHKMKTIVS